MQKKHFEKHCSSCKKVRKVSEFYRRGKNLKGFSSWCKACHKLDREKRQGKTSEYTKKRSTDFREYKKTLNCLHCGYPGKTWPEVLDFHHRDPKTKKFNIGTDSVRFPSKTFMTELAKCDVLCAICHRILHAKFSRKKEKK